jgi:CRISPR-associated protein (TIGR03986 family)
MTNPNQAWERPNTKQKEGFHNPYNFVPALPRNIDNPELGDHCPAGHDCYKNGHWSGEIAVTLTTQTPLLIPDASKVTELHLPNQKVHQSHPLRIVDNKPHLPPTSIKGMLRSAYEAITNSRLSVFSEHDDRLFYRMAVSDGLSLVPAIIKDKKVTLMRGTTEGFPIFNPKNGKWSIEDKLMYAAWVPRYHDRPGNNLNLGDLQHGDQVRVWLEQYQKLDRSDTPIFKYWKVREIISIRRQLGRKPEAISGRGNHLPTGAEIIEAEGYLCITGNNIKNKHDERVFFNKSIENNDHSCAHSISELQQDWEYLIGNYQKLHKGETRDEGLEWSRHVTGDAGECQIGSGERPTLCYAFIDTNQVLPRITALYPVMISRAVYASAPSKLLSLGDDDDKNDYNLKPAISISKLSPADRVFGWVSQDGSGSYRGNLRIYDVQCTSENSIEFFGNPGLPLSILGQPKPQQGRFYAAKNDQGDPVERGTSKGEMYRPRGGLRGRKVYPHHQGLPENYWKNPLEDRTQQDGVYQEYRRPRKVPEGGGEPQEQRDSQNRSIQAWVKPGVTFTFKVSITNLSTVELGALLWLLDLPAKHYHRLGGGKPLGFGSVTLQADWEQSDLRTGEDWQKYYSSLQTPAQATQFVPKSAIEAFKNAVAVKTSYGSDVSGFEEVSFIKAFCQAAKGFDDGQPIHYPRNTPNPDPEGESFKWFTENERLKDQKRSLPPLTDDPGLPYWGNS